jgi:hypothetical protein
MTKKTKDSVGRLAVFGRFTDTYNKCAVIFATNFFT